jgi:hypothetical protein
MIDIRVAAPLLQRALLFTVAFAAGSPALADHMGPSGVGSGGGMSVFSPDTLDEGHWAAGLRLTYTRPEHRSDAELEALSAQGIGAHNTNYNAVAAIGVAYGITHELTVSAELPYVRRDKLRAAEPGDGVERLGSVSGIGDLSLLAKYRLTQAPQFGFAVIGGIKMPTGSTHKRDLEGAPLETEHQPGTGSWDPIFGASASANLGPVQLTGSALYQLSTRGAQHTRLGDRMQGGVALSHRFGPAPHEHIGAHNRHHGDELDEHREGPHHSTWDAFVELAGEWEGRQKIDGKVEEASGGKWAYLAPGLRFNAAAGWSASAALAVPVWQRIRASHPDNRYRLMLSLGKAF